MVPLAFRTVSMDVVSFFWDMYLCAKMNDDDDDDDDKKEEDNGEAVGGGEGAAAELALLSSQVSHVAAEGDERKAE